MTKPKNPSLFFVLGQELGSSGDFQARLAELNRRPDLHRKRDAALHDRLAELAEGIQLYRDRDAAVQAAGRATARYLVEVRAQRDYIFSVLGLDNPRNEGDEPSWPARAGQGFRTVLSLKPEGLYFVRVHDLASPAAAGPASA